MNHCIDDDVVDDDVETETRIDEAPLVIAFLFDYVTFWRYYAFRLTFNGPVAMQLTTCFHIE